MPVMSDLKPVMVRLPPDVYEKLRAQAFRSAIPPAVLARAMIKQQLEAFDGPGELQEPSPAVAPKPSQTSTSSSRRRSSNAKRRKNKKRER